MGEGIGRADLKNGAVNYQKMSFGGRLKTFSFAGAAPLTGITDLRSLGVPTQDFQVTKVTAVLDRDGLGSGNTVTIDILDDGVSILSTLPDFAVTNPIATPNNEAVLDATKSLIAKGSAIQLSLASTGTTTAGHDVGVEVEGHYVD